MLCPQNRCITVRHASLRLHGSRTCLNSKGGAKEVLMVNMARRVNWDAFCVRQATCHTEESQLAEKMGPTLGRVDDLQQRITEAQAQLQAFTTQCREATESLCATARLTTGHDAFQGSAADTGFSHQRVYPEKAEPTPENADPNTSSCIWRTVGPDPLVSSMGRCSMLCETGLGISSPRTSLLRCLHSCSQC